jgi:hypothetical protein
MIGAGLLRIAIERDDAAGRTNPPCVAKILRPMQSGSISVIKVQVEDT